MNQGSYLEKIIKFLEQKIIFSKQIFANQHNCLDVSVMQVWPIS